MNERHATIALAAVFLCGLLAAGALAQSGAAIDWWVLAGGGAPSTGGSVALDDTLGQPIIGPASGGNIALEAGYWSGALPPTAVMLASFTATRRDGAIAVAWETASETALEGFHVYRQATEGELVRLNEALIPCQKPGSPAGASYEFVDEAVVPGVTYWYWLDVVDNHSGATRHGPVMATVPAGPAHRIYLPLVGW
jgi:hypothetical protein